MFRSLGLIALLIFVRSGPGQSVSNPLLGYPDPFITHEPVKGKYLLLATTGNNITIWSGLTVETSASSHKVVFASPSDLSELWSPTIWQFDNRYWIYFTARRSTAGHVIYVLQSDTSDPLGTYSFRGELNLDHPAIDPSLLVVNGAWYLMYASLDGGENAIRIVRLPAPMQTAGSSSLISEPEFLWEKGGNTPKTYPVHEGPTALYHDGKTFIVYSASDTASPAYCLGLLTFQGGDPLNRQNWVKTTKPVFETSPANSIYGPGRGTFALAADGSNWLLYAARSISIPTPAGRETRAQQFTWTADGLPIFGIPQKDGPIPAWK